MARLGIQHRPHNPGPSWGFRVILFWDRILPGFILNPAKSIAAFVAMLVMPAQRKHSKDYLSEILKRPATLRDCSRHFDSFTRYLCNRVRSAFDDPIGFRWAEGHGKPFLELMEQDQPILMGTFHVGYSDLMGFFTRSFKKKIHMLRLKMDNSEDTERLERMAGKYLNIIWVNQIQDTIYALKEVIYGGGSVAMQCDRVQHSSKLESFSFLGKRRQFPFTIYSLAILFDIPVIFVIATEPDHAGEVPVYTSSVFIPNKSGKKANLLAAKAHFQAVLVTLESILEESPYLWFNFEPLNPVENS